MQRGLQSRRLAEQASLNQQMQNACLLTVAIARLVKSGKIVTAKRQ